MFTNQWRMSALQYVPSEMRDHFPLLCVLKSHYAITSLLAPLVFIVKYGCEKPGNITIDYFPSCCGTLGFFSFPLSRITGVCFQSFDISKVLLYTNDLSHRAQNNIQSASVMWTRCTCHFMKFNLTWSANSCTSHHAAWMWLWKFSMSGRLCLSLPLPLFGRCKWCKFLSCSTPMLFWCDGNPFARPITPSHQHYSFMLSALFSFLGGNPPEIHSVPLNFPGDAGRKHTLVIFQGWNTWKTSEQDISCHLVLPGRITS